MPESIPGYAIQGIAVLAIVVVLLIALSIVNRIVRNSEFPADPLEDFVVKESKATFISGIGFIAFCCLVLVVTSKVVIPSFEIGKFVYIFYGFAGLLALLGVYYIVRWIIVEVRVEGDSLKSRSLFGGSAVKSLSSIARIRFKDGTTHGGKTGHKVVYFFDSSDKKMLSVRCSLLNAEALYQRAQISLARQSRKR